MPELWLPRTAEPTERAKVRVGTFAARQKGRVTRAQLISLGVPNSTITYWHAAGYLYPQLPNVYAVGHPACTDESDLFSAVLYAGPRAGLTGITGGLWRGLVKWRTAEAIEVSTPRRCRSLSADDPANRLGKAIEVRDRRRPGRRDYRGIPTVPLPRLVLDVARTGDLQLVRFVLAQMDYLRILRVPELEAVCGRGVPGSALLHEALGCPQPRFARARSPFEIELLVVCESTGIPLPETNQKIAGIEVDAVWRDQMVIVECDGEGNHGTWRQRRRDAADEMTLRSLGFLIIRYTSDQLKDPRAIHADLMPILEERRGRALAA